MIATRFYLDTRDCAPGSPAPVKLSLTKQRVRALIPLGVSLLPSQWDAARQTVVSHPQKRMINSLLAEQKATIDTLLFRLSASGALQNLRACDIKRLVMAEIHPEDAPAPARPLFLPRLDALAAQRSAGTQRVYNSTRSRLRAYLGDALAALAFEDMTVQWLRDFDAFLAKTAPSRNARNIHFRNIRAVFNDAIGDELISCYPFRKFKCTPAPTRKRSLSIDQLRMLFSAEVEPHEQRYLDCFKIIFMLCGINIVDLCRLTSVTDGRVEYSRAKTHRLYSIKVEPECAELLARHRGKDWLLSYLDACANYRFFYNRLNACLHVIASRLGLPPISTYWARHSWATIARSIGVSVDDIALALGHGDGHDLTHIYIDDDKQRIDEANRRVLDWVLYGKK